MTTEDKVRFPVGGPRIPVYQFLSRFGFIESQWSDKHWERADGVNLYLYGAGSMARIQDKDGHVMMDAPLDAAVLSLPRKP